MSKTLGEISQLIDEQRVLLKKANEAIASGEAQRLELVILIAKAETMRDFVSAGMIAEAERIERLMNAGRVTH
jgi:hypothetical protein